MGMISEELLGRLRARAADDQRRTDAVPATGTSFGDGAYQTVVGGLDGSRPEPPAPLPPPALPTALAAAEARLGFSIPDDLTQIYIVVAEGGFGPSGGLASLEAIADRYGQLTADPPGEGGQTWPQHLLPIGLSSPGADCYDLRSGRIVYWDEESIGAGPGDQIWESSFKDQAESLSDWLEAWLARPASADLASAAAHEAALAHLRQTLPLLRAMTVEEREDIGIIGDDWEESHCRRLGIDPADV